MINMMSAFELFRSHITRRAHDLMRLRHQRRVGQLLRERLRQAEVDDLHARRLRIAGDEHVARLQVTVNDPFLVSMLDRRANLLNQLQALRQRALRRLALPQPSA